MFIKDLSLTPDMSDNDNIPLYDANSGRTRAVLASTLKAYVQGSQVAPTNLLLVPVTGGSYVMDQGVQNVILDPASSLALLSIKLPLGTVDGQLFNVITSQGIASLTLTPANALQYIRTTTTALTAGSSAQYIFSYNNQMWYRK